ncbi:MAG: hypothetical protein IJR36_03035 [Lachnospiraceae bacterium]|nr:hypothetical protein [Lachnospiraceae bacterium]MBR0154434.1 hypothetical protein [Lachnospiraceae bacterium]
MLIWVLLARDNNIVREQLKFDGKVCLMIGNPPRYRPRLLLNGMELIENFKDNNQGLYIVLVLSFSQRKKKRYAENGLTAERRL